MTRWTRSFGFLFGILALARVDAAAQDTSRSVTLVYSYNSATPPGLAVMPVMGLFGDSVRAILQRDLDHSDRFKMVSLVGNDPTVFHPANGLLNYSMFAGLQARFVVEPKVTATGIHIVIHDVDSANVVKVQDWLVTETGLSRDWRMRIHSISDAIQAVITGAPGIAATRISYYRQQSIHIVDSDGASDVALAVDSEAYASAWHPSGLSLAYSTIGANSQVFTLDLATGRSKVIVPYRVNYNNSGPTFSPDGLSVYYFQSGDVGADIYRVTESEGWIPRRLTSRSGDNMMPSVNPSGNRIAFATTRTGHAEVYTMNIDGTDAEPIPSWRDTSTDLEPAWSPDGGTKLAYTSEKGGPGRYQIFVRNMLDGTVKQVTSEGVNQQPSWAPDGQHLVFESDRTGQPQLHVLDLETNVTRQLTVARGSKLPAWSPRLIR